MDPIFVQNLHGLLQQTTAPDTTLIKAATATLNREYYKDPRCIPALFEIIATSPEYNVRQLAAVELRKRTLSESGALWESVPSDTRQTIRDKILVVTFNEQNSLVRHAISRVIAAIAEIELPLGTWSDLLPSLIQTATSNVVSQRETGAYTLFQIVDKIGSELMPQLSDFFNLFSSLAHDNDSLEVRVTSVRALGVMAEYIDADQKAAIRQYQEILPSLMVVLGQVIEANDEKRSREIFDVFDTLLILEVPLISKHVPQLVQFLLQYSRKQDVDEEIRNMTLNALNWTVKYKRTKIQNNHLAAQILENLLPIATERVPEDSDEDSPSRSALRVIDVLALSLPASQVFPPVRQLAQQYMLSPEPTHRRAALMMLGTCVEGIAEYLANHMQDVWAVIDRGMADSDAEVRKAACTAIGCLCDYCEEDCAGRHAVLMPAILELLNDPATQKAACIALDSMLEILPNDVDPYLNMIMERLVALLGSVPAEIQSVVMGAIGSAAHSSKERFIPYFEVTVNKIQQFLSLGDSIEEVELKGITMDSFGTIAQAVGKDHFRPYFADCMRQAFVFLESGDARLSECSFITFDVMSDVFGEEFAPYLPTVIPAIIKSLQQEEHPFDDEDTLTSSAASFTTGDATGESSSTAIPVPNPVVVDVEDIVKVSTAICIEKANAANALSSIFVATKRHFLPYVESITLELLRHVTHYSDNVRKASADSLLSICQVFYQLSEPTEWIAGLPAQIPLHQNVRDLVNHILPKILEAAVEDDEKTVVCTQLVGLAETINEVGPGFIESHVKGIFEIATTVLEQKAVCQLDPDIEEGESFEEEEQSEEDSLLISAAADVVAALASALGSQFTEPFQSFFPLIVKYYGKGRSVSDRSSTVGCMGEIIGGMKSAITPFTEPVLQLLSVALTDSDKQVQSNGAFAAGMLVENSEADLSSQYLPLLSALRPLFDVNESSNTAALHAHDNAAGAVARMIIKNTAAVPLDQVLQILIGCLPIKTDFLENRPIFRAIFHLVQTNPGVLAPYLDKLLSVFAYVLNPDGPDQLGDETRGGILELLVVFNGQVPEKVQAAGLGIYLPSA